MDLILEEKELSERKIALMFALRRTFQDTEFIGHNRRWEHYLAWYRLGGSEHRYTWDGWNNIIPEHDEPICYDGMVHAERYSSIDLVEQLEAIMESLVCNEDSKFSKEYYRLEEAGCDDPYLILVNHPMMVELREALMKAAISSVYYDW